jgi:hypothetical protein
LKDDDATSTPRETVEPHTAVHTDSESDKSDVQDKLKDNKINKPKGEKKRSKVLGIAKRLFKVSPKILRNGDKKKKLKRGAVTPEMKEDIVEFLEMPDNAINLPDHKAASKKHKKPKMMLNKSMKQHYLDYSSKRKHQIGFSTFCRQRPKYVVPKRYSKWTQNLCEVCENVELKIKVVASKIGATNRYVTVKNTLCARNSEKIFNRQCVERTCSDCGVKGLKTQLQNTVTQEEIEWKEWQLIEICGKKKKGLVVCKKPKEVFIKKFCEAIHDLAKHLHQADWQYTQYNLKRKHPNEGELVLGMDFSENFRTCYQREVSSAHWGYSQVSLHTMVAHYICPKEGCDEVIKEGITAVSSNLKHDTGAVAAYIEAARNHLTQVRNLKIDHQTFYSDQCASQYKCLKAFYRLSQYPISTQHEYFAPGHGKSLMDGEGAVVKSHVTAKVKSMQCQVRNATDFLAACSDFNDFDDIHTQHLTKKSLRTVILVNESKDAVTANIKKIEGSRKLFSIRNDPQMPGYIKGRNLTCHCGCVGGSQCENADYVDSYVPYSLVHEDGTKKSKSAGSKRYFIHNKFQN